MPPPACGACRLPVSRSLPARQLRGLSASRLHTPLPLHLTRPRRLPTCPAADVTVLSTRQRADPADSAWQRQGHHALSLAMSHAVLAQRCAACLTGGGGALACGCLCVCVYVWGMGEFSCAVPRLLFLLVGACLWGAAVARGRHSQPTPPTAPMCMHQV